MTEWIDANERAPEKGQIVVFAPLLNRGDQFDRYRNKPMIGTYYGHLDFNGKWHDFSTPGVGWLSHYWLPLDVLPPVPDER